MGTFLSIAISIGLPLAVNWIQEWIETSRRKGLNKQGLSPSMVTKVISKMANEAKSRGSNIVDQLYDKLQNTQFYGAASGVVKDYLAKARSKAESRYKLAKEKFNDISDKANSVMDQASIFNYESDRYKKSKEGKSELRDIKNEAISLNEDLKGVEKYV